MKRVLTFTVTLIMVLSLCACGQKVEAPTWQEQYDLGVRYLSEGKYEEAVLAFTVAIEIEPKRVEAYIGLAEVYAAQEDTERAVKILNRAIAEIGETTELIEALEKLVSTSKPEPEQSELTVSNIYPLSMNQKCVSWSYEKDSELAKENEGAIGSILIMYTLGQENLSVWDTEVDVLPAGFASRHGIDAVIEDCVERYYRYRDFDSPMYQNRGSVSGGGIPIFIEGPVDIVVVEFDKKTESKDAQVVGYMLFEGIILDG